MSPQKSHTVNLWASPQKSLNLIVIGEVMVSTSRVDRWVVGDGTIIALYTIQYGISLEPEI